MGISIEQLKELGCKFHHGAILSDVYYWNDIKMHANPGGGVSEPDQDGYDDIHPVYAFEPPSDDYYNEVVTICYLHTADEFKQWAETFDLEKWKAEHYPSEFRKRDKTPIINEPAYGGISRVGYVSSFISPVGLAPWWNANVLKPKEEK